MLLAISSDIKHELNTQNELVKTNEYRKKHIESFYEIIELHSDAKQLSRKIGISPSFVIQIELASMTRNENSVSNILKSNQFL